MSIIPSKYVLPNKLPVDLVKIVCEYAVPTNLAEGDQTDLFLIIIRDVAQHLWQNAFPQHLADLNREQYPIIQTWIDQNNYPRIENMQQCSNRYNYPRIENMKHCFNRLMEVHRHFGQRTMPTVPVHPALFMDVEKDVEKRAITSFCNVATSHFEKYGVDLPKFSNPMEARKWAADQGYRYRVNYEPRQKTYGIEIATRFGSFRTESNIASPLAVNLPI